MAKLSEINESYNNLLLLAGSSGSGKTCSIVSLAHSERMYIFDFDQRVSGAFGLRSKLAAAIANVDFDYYDILNSLEQIEGKLESMYEQACKDKLPYKFIVLESVDAIINCFLDRAAGLAKMNVSGLGKMKIGNVEMNDPSHYRFAYACWARLISNLRRFPSSIRIIFSVNIVDEFGTETITDPKTGQTVPKPYGKQIVTGEKLNLPTQLGAKVPGDFDEVYVFHKEHTELASRPARYSVTFRDGRLAKTAREHYPVSLDLTNLSFADAIQKLEPKDIKNATS